MSRKENPETVKARNARPDRSKARQAQGNLWMKNHRDRANAYGRKSRAKKGMYAQMIDEIYNPIIVTSQNVAITSDYHIPFYDNDLLNQLLTVPEEHGTTDLIIAGDFFDCDDYSRFTHLTPPACFDSECEEVKKVLNRILNVFTNVYICRGNHEKRFIDMNAGKINMPQMFALCRPSYMSEDAWEERVHITRDDHIHLFQKDSNGMQLWLCCHPKNYRQINLSVGKDLAAKHQCHVIVAHGHQWAQGYDRSGTFHLLDGGGLFDRDALAYLRDTATNPMTHGGFYVLKDGQVIPYEGKA